MVPKLQLNDPHGGIRNVSVSKVIHKCFFSIILKHIEKIKRNFICGDTPLFNLEKCYFLQSASKVETYGYTSLFYF
jgi:hypothetical protein